LSSFAVVVLLHMSSPRPAADKKRRQQQTSIALYTAAREGQQQPQHDGKRIKGHNTDIRAQTVVA
jgi:protein tyrosine/serine phosphatase